MTGAVQEAKGFNRTKQMGEVTTLFETRLPLLVEALGSKPAAQRFKRVVITAIQHNPELLECQPLSLWNASMKCANAGHIPDGRDAALVVFKDKNLGKIAQHMPMRFGITRQILKSPEISTLHNAVVHEADEWLYEEGDTPFIRHVPKRGDRGPVIAAYSVATFKDGNKTREWMWREDIDKARAVAKTQNVWNQWFDEMARKTVLKRHAKMLPMTNDTELMLARDDALMAGEGEVDDDGNVQSPRSASPPPEPRALSDALNLLANSPDEPRGGHAPFDAETGELAADEPQGEIIDQQPAGEKQQPSEQQKPVEDQQERVRHLKLLNDAATAGALDRVYVRFSAHWQKALEAEYTQLKTAKESSR